MKQFFILLIVLLTLLSCNNRTDPISLRNNPYDSGGEDFSINGAPELLLTLDSLWDDFDHENGTGSVRFFFKATDPNLPHDTLETHLFFGNGSTSMGEVTPETDTSFIVTGLEPGTTYLCSCTVDDRFDGHDTVLLAIATPVLIPPLPPEPSMTINETSVTITWSAVSGATGYRLYGSDTYTGPYEIDTLLAGQGTSINITLPLDATSSRFYLAASFNQAGESKADDTLHARLFSPQITVPVVDSVSKGAYEEYIQVAWHCTDKNAKKYEIYRSTFQEGPYQPFTVVTAASGENFYNDSVETTQTFHYKIAAIDKNSRSSNLSNSDCGYIHRFTTSALLSVESTSEYIMLFWNFVPEASGYAVYRSSSSCSADPVRLATTKALNYFDTVTSTAAFYYSVAVIDNNGNEGVKSNCVPGSLGLLPAPQGFQVLNDVTPNIITIRWNATPGASSYIVYRGTAGCPTSSDFISTPKTTEYNDKNISGTTVYFYAVAAVDKGGRVGAMSTCSKGSADLLPSVTGLSVSYGTVADAIVLTWNRLAKAKTYQIYRSAESCSKNMVKIATVNLAAYIDSVPTTNIYYYKVAGVDSAGVEGSPSACWEGRVKLLLAPSNVQASLGNYHDGIRVTWNSVADAKGYIIYRGTSSSFTSAAIIDTVVTLAYFDSVTTAATRYYWVAALGRTGPGTRSNSAYGYISAPPSLIISQYTSSVVISWKSLVAASMNYIMRGRDTLNLVIKDSTTGVSYTDVPADFEDYYYRIIVKSTTGTLIPSNIVRGHRLLSPPTGLKATDYSTGVVLQWNSIAGVTGFTIYRSTSPGDATFYKDVSDTAFYDELSTNTRYYYRVAAHVGSQRSSMSGYVIGGVIQTPAVPISVRTSSTTDAILVLWYVSSGSSTPDGFNVYRSTSYSGVFSLIDSTKEALYADSVTDTSTYYYRVAAYNASGTSQLSTTVSGVLEAPIPPDLVHVTQALYCTHVRVSWEPVNRATAYSVYRSTVTRSGFEKIATVDDTVYNDSSAEVNTRYYYRITTHIGDREGTQSNSFAGMRLGAPSSVSLSPSIRGIYIYWSNIVYSVQTYYVYRSGSSSGPFVKIDSLSSTSYLDSNEATGNNYYRISAKNFDESPLSIVAGPAHRNFPDPPFSIAASQGTDSAGITVSWEPTLGATGYRIYRSMTDSFTTTVTLVATVNATVYFDSVPSDSFYYYKIKSFNSGGESSMSLETGRGFRRPSTVPKPVTDIDTIDLGYSGGIYLTWTVSSQTIAYTGFQIYRAEAEDGTYQLIDATAETTYFDEPPSSFPVVYWYKVSAYNQKGESTLSKAVSGTRR